MKPLLDTIILAAGHNTRLKGLVPTALKPLLVVNGRTLIAHLVHQALVDANAASVVTIVNPINAGHITEVVGNQTHLMIQAQPTGPLDAVRLGMRMCQHDLVMILCADNIIPFHAVQQVTEEMDMSSLVVTCRSMPANQAGRFTTVLEESFLPAGVPNEASERVSWIGPVVAPRRLLQEALEECDEQTDAFADVFNWLVKPAGLRLKRVFADVTDIGVPGELV